MRIRLAAMIVALLALTAAPATAGALGSDRTDRVTEQHTQVLRGDQATSASPAKHCHTNFAIWSPHGIFLQCRGGDYAWAKFRFVIPPDATDISWTRPRPAALLPPPPGEDPQVVEPAAPAALRGPGQSHRVALVRRPSRRGGLPVVSTTRVSIHLDACEGGRTRPGEPIRTFVPDGLVGKGHIQGPEGSCKVSARCLAAFPRGCSGSLALLEGGHP